MLSLRAHAHGVKQMKIISKEKTASQIKSVRKDSKKAVMLLANLWNSNMHDPSPPVRLIKAKVGRKTYETILSVASSHWRDKR